MFVDDEDTPEINFYFYVDFSAGVQLSQLTVGSIHKATANTNINVDGFQTRFVQP